MGGVVRSLDQRVHPGRKRRGEAGDRTVRPVLTNVGFPPQTRHRRGGDTLRRGRLDPAAMLGSAARDAAMHPGNTPSQNAQLSPFERLKTLLKSGRLFRMRSSALSHYRFLNRRRDVIAHARQP